MTEPTRIVIMGVSGCGKSSAGEALAEATGERYIDGDDLHSPESIAKIQANTPLKDADRWPWLARVRGTLAARGGNNTIIGCSVLKRIYRDRIRRTPANRFSSCISPVRGCHRRAHENQTGAFHADLAARSQFAALEPPTADECSVTVMIGQPLAPVVAMVKTSIWTLTPPVRAACNAT
jgi:gluconokinase